MSKVWYITGGSKGLGLALVQHLLKKGYFVAATSRNREKLIAAVSATNTKNFLPLEVELTNEHAIEESLKEVHDYFGRLDVIVNNAGYGIAGPIEELTTAELESSFNINYWATVQVIRKALPYLRSQKSGHIINISSIGGFSATIGWSAYSAAKFAVVGLTEGLAQDVKHLGIKATVVCPGAFRTDFLTMNSLDITSNKFEDYLPIHQTYERFHEMNGKQIGDPQKLVMALEDITHDPNPPVMLFLGTDAYKRAVQKIRTLSEELAKYESITNATDI